MYEAQTENVIRQRLLNACNSSLNKNEGGFLWDALSPAAIELAQAYIELDRVLKLGFAQSTYGNFLDMRAAEHGITRLTNESDSALLARLLYKVQMPLASGNANSYIFWATSVDGVGHAAVIPLWAGPGTVKVVITDSNKLPVTSDIVSAADTYIQSQKPIGATVTTVSATTKTINVSATLTLMSGFTLSQVTTAFTTKLTEYFKSIALGQTFVSFAKIGAVLLNTDGVADYSSLQINSTTANVTMLATEVPVAGTVTLI